MARTATQAPTRARRGSVTEKRNLNGNRPKGEQDLTSDRDEQRQSDEVGEQDDLRREPRRQARGTRRTVNAEPMMAEPEMAESDDDRLEQQADRVMPSASSGVDALGPALTGWGQVYTSMFELALDMMKLQQRTFASMLGVTDTSARGITRGISGNRVNDAVSAARTSSAAPHQVAPDQVEHDRS
jgi:hypothetical protein